jgi:hypothetical protein
MTFPERYSFSRNAIGFGLLLALLFAEMFCASQYMIPTIQPTTLVGSIGLGSLLGLLATIQHMRDSVLPKKEHTKRDLRRRLQMTLPTMLLSGVLMLTLLRGSVAHDQSSLLWIASKILNEGAWPFLIVTTGTIIVGMMSWRYARGILTE